MNYEHYIKKKINKLTDKFIKQDEKDIILKAYEVAKDAHEGQLRKAGDPFLVHPVLTAEIVCNLGLDAESVVTALLHDTVEDSDINSNSIIDSRINLS